jgi:hypothetical protein
VVMTWRTHTLQQHCLVVEKLDPGREGLDRSLCRPLPERRIGRRSLMSVKPFAHSEYQWGSPWSLAFQDGQPSPLFTNGKTLSSCHRWSITRLLDSLEYTPRSLTPLHFSPLFLVRLS